MLDSILEIEGMAMDVKAHHVFHAGKSWKLEYQISVHKWGGGSTEKLNACHSSTTHSHGAAFGREVNKRDTMSQTWMHAHA